MIDNCRTHPHDVEWLIPSFEPRLENGDVHVWKADLNCTPEALARLESTLNEEERIRADRLVFERDRNQFVAARGILRTILGRYLHCSPGGVLFAYEPDGKPRLCESTVPVRFNISHSQGLALLAFARDHEIGIDIEAMRIDIDAEEIATRFFSLTEQTELRALRPEHRTEGFFLCWTRKEAYVKARGGGLGIPLDSFSVSLTPGTPATLRSLDGERWTLRSFRPSPGYAAAVVAEGRSRTFSYWSYSSVPRR